MVPGDVVYVSGCWWSSLWLGYLWAKGVFSASSVVEMGE